MKPLLAPSLTVFAAYASLAAAGMAAEAKVRLAEVTLERSAIHGGGPRTHLKIVPRGGKLLLASNVDRLRLALGVELRGAGKVRRIVLVLPRALGGTRQTLFSSKTGGPSVQVDFRLRAGEKLRGYVAASGLALCRAGNPTTVTVGVPVGLAIDARNGSRRVFRLRRTIPVVVSCPVAAGGAEIGRKLGRKATAGAVRDSDQPEVNSPPADRPREADRDPIQEGADQRPPTVAPEASRAPRTRKVLSPLEQTRQAPAASS